MGIYKWSDSLHIVHQRTHFHAHLVGWLKGAVSVSPMKLLDIGTGTGDIIYEFIQTQKDIRFSTIHLLEPSPEAMNECQERMAGIDLPTQFFPVSVQKALKQGLLPEGYDLILASHVFYYIKDTVSCIRELQSLLSPGGRLVITLRSRQSDGYSLRQLIGEMMGEVDKKYYSAYDLHVELEAAGIQYETQALPYAVACSQADVMAFLTDDGSGEIAHGFIHHFLRLVGHRPAYIWEEVTKQALAAFLLDKLHTNNGQLWMEDEIFVIRRARF